MMLEPYYQDESVIIYHGDCREVLPGLELGQADLYLADPPYGMGKQSDGVHNDNHYGPKLDAFLMECWFAARPHLKDNASAYIWGNPKDLWRLWYVGGLNDSERLTFRNEIVWQKGTASAGGISHQGASGLRQYPGETERALFFMLGEQRFNNNADNYWDGWEPIRASLAKDCDCMGWGPADIIQICGVSMYSHWFTKSQWCFIPREHYEKLQAASCNAFKREYDVIKREFYSARAYFNNTHDLMSDCWKFPRVTGIERFGHATPKPVDLMVRCICSSCPPGGLVLDSFMGTGSSLRAAKDQGCRAIGIELEERYCEIAANRCRQGVLEYA